ncbi:YopT-type cysteine protease domain-containing protein [Microbulbifer sp. SAOS-129_SWC]|uniref:YopT-type cysteine protease domain-containing protein n=1 Tax=Microbulbifer sp. SAOS-129_SWC TaxID=3145235 RepID=UPI003216392F
MAGHYNFQALREHALKVYKFQQGKSIQALNPHGEINGGAINAVHLPEDHFDLIKGGVCASLTCAWLKEKRTRGGVFNGDSAGDAIHSERNRDTVMRAAPRQIQYSGNFQQNDIVDLYRLKRNEDLDNVLVKSRVKFEQTLMSGYVQRGYRQVIEVQPSIVNACDPAYLKRGRGVYMSFTLKSTLEGRRGGGHAAGAYRSRGNHLYFFDSNCGVYQINDPDGFFGAWIDCYANLGLAVTINTTANDGFSYVGS